MHNNHLANIHYISLEVQGQLQTSNTEEKLTALVFIFSFLSTVCLVIICPQRNTQSYNQAAAV